MNKKIIISSALVLTMITIVTIYPRSVHANVKTSVVKAEADDKNKIIQTIRENIYEDNDGKIIKRESFNLNWEKSGPSWKSSDTGVGNVLYQKVPEGYKKIIGFYKYENNPKFPKTINHIPVKDKNDRKKYRFISVTVLIRDEKGRPLERHTFYVNTAKNKRQVKVTAPDGTNFLRPEDGSLLLDYNHPLMELRVHRNETSAKQNNTNEVESEKHSSNCQSQKDEIITNHYQKDEQPSAIKDKTSEKKETKAITNKPNPSEKISVNEDDKPPVEFKNTDVLVKSSNSRLADQVPPIVTSDLQKNEAKPKSEIIKESSGAATVDPSVISVSPIKKVTPENRPSDLKGLEKVNEIDNLKKSGQGKKANRKTIEQMRKLNHPVSDDEATNKGSDRLPQTSDQSSIISILMSLIGWGILFTLRLKRG